MQETSPKSLTVRSIWGEFAPAFVIVVNTLVWYIISLSVLSSMIDDLSTQGQLEGLLYSSYYLATAFSAILGAIILPRLKGIGISLWMLFGAVMSLIMLSIPSNVEWINLLIVIILGISIGSGLPSTLAYFANRAPIHKRGFFGGVSWGAIGFMILLLLFFMSIFGTLYGLLALFIWRLIGFGVFTLLDNRRQISNNIKKVESYRNILRKKDVLLYLLPWVMFSLVNFIEAPILIGLMGNLATTLAFVEFVIVGFFALIGGTLADRIGRKRVVIAGFVFLGINYAALSVFYANPISWYLYTLLDGVTWGMFAAVFFMALWGDLAMNSKKEKYYVLGGLPYLLSGFLPILVQTYILSVPPSMAFSVASFFLFIAVLPLIYAPETLPEKHIKDRELKSYIEKAKQVAQKHEDRDHKVVKTKTNYRS